MIVMTMWRGPFCDHLVFFPTPDDLMGLADRCRSHEVFRIRHALDRVDVPRASHMSEDWTRCIDLSLGHEAIRSAMSKTARYELRQAEKLSERLELRRNDAQSKADFFRLLIEFIEWSQYTYPLRKKRYRKYLEVADVNVAYLDGTPVVGHLVMCDAGAARVRLTFSASIRFREGPFQKLTAPINRWLHWQEFLFYSSRKYETYDFGGANLGKTIGLFKASLGGEMRMGWDVVFGGALGGPALRMYEGRRTSLQHFLRRS
jgi:hypothetical protein